MAAVSTIQEINRELATRINKETRKNPQSPYANKLVGIANGQVVLVADDDDFDTFARRLREIEPDPIKAFWVEASNDLTKPVWV
jgi:hypothetical protein